MSGTSCSVSDLSDVACRSLLRTQGYIVTALPSLIEVPAAIRLGLDAARRKEHVITDEDGAIRVVALLNESDAALNVLNNPAFSHVIDTCLSPNVILSSAEGIVGPRRASRWRREFDAVLVDLPSRTFRPGITAWLPLDSTGGTIEILLSSQHIAARTPNPQACARSAEINVNPGCVALLEGGVYYRLPSNAQNWLSFTFVRAWMKPKVLFYTALDRDRLNQLDERAQQLCGKGLGLPVTIDEFLAIEAAAVDGQVGRAKGSGV